MFLLLPLLTSDSIAMSTMSFCPEELERCLYDASPSLFSHLLNENRMKKNINENRETRTKITDRRKGRRQKNIYTESHPSTVCCVCVHIYLIAICNIKSNNNVRSSRNTTLVLEATRLWVVASLYLWREEKKTWTKQCCRDTDSVCISAIMHVERKKRRQKIQNKKNSPNTYSRSLARRSPECRWKHCMNTEHRTQCRVCSSKA